MLEIATKAVTTMKTKHESVQNSLAATFLITI